MASPQASSALAPHLGINVERLIKSVPGLEAAAKSVAGALHSAILSGGDATRSAADVLHGTWIGHPLHPLLVTLPIGAWSFAALYDVAAVVSGSDGAARTADTLIALGAAAAVPTALAGMADYSAIKQDAAAEGLVHGALNSAALGLYLLSLGARVTGRRGAGLVLSSVALGVVGVSGWLGAELIYRHRVGVNHSEAPEHASGWIAVLREDELALGQSRRVLVGQNPVMLHRSAEALYAIGAVCAHAGAPLEEGRVEGTCVECPWHQSVFDLRDGRVVHGPATQPQQRYEVRVLGGLIQVRLPEGARAPFDSEQSPLEREVGGG